MKSKLIEWSGDASTAKLHDATIWVHPEGDYNESKVNLLFTYDNGHIDRIDTYVTIFPELYTEDLVRVLDWLAGYPEAKVESIRFVCDNEDAELIIIRGTKLATQTGFRRVILMRDAPADVAASLDVVLEAMKNLPGKQDPYVGL